MRWVWLESSKVPCKWWFLTKASWWLPLCLQFSSEEKSPPPEPPEIFEAQGEHTVIAHHLVACFVRGATDKLAPSAREMGWMQLNHSFIHSSWASCLVLRHPPAFLPALPSVTLEFCVSLWRISVSHFLPVLRAALSPSPTFTVPWKLLPRHCPLCRPSFEISPFLLQWGWACSPLVTRPPSLASLALSWCFFF